MVNAMTNNAADRLRAYFPASKLYTVLVGKSRTGMERKFRVLVAFTSPGNGIHIGDVSAMVARVVGLRFDEERGALIVRGTGFNASQDIAASLGNCLFGDTGAIKWESL